MAGAVLFVLGGIAFVGAQFGNKPIIAADTPEGETKSVIVAYKNASQVSPKGDVNQQQENIQAAGQQIADNTPYSLGYKQQERTYQNLPYAVYTVDEAGEASLKDDPNVAAVFPVTYSRPLLYSSIPTIGGNTTTGFSDGSTNYTGDGYTVAVLDTGVESNHTMLNGKVVAEACFNTNYSAPGFITESRCPGGATSSTAAGSAADCDPAVWEGCGHGTGVASIAAGVTTPVTDGGGFNEVLSGVAKDASILGINVFSKVTSVEACGDTDPCVLSLSSDQFAALDYIISLASAGTLPSPLAAVNMSLGSVVNSTDSQAVCDADPSVQPINTAAGTLKGYGVATIISAGNSGDQAGQENKIGTPGCAANAIAVAATNRAGDTIASYSNNGPLTDLLAPGGDSGDLMLLAQPGDAFTESAGTSMAAPIVAGAFAVLREKHPNASVDALLGLLQTTGVNVTDARAGYTVGAKKRINLATALTQSGYPEISNFAGPSGTVNEGAGITLTADVADATSCSLNNGVGTVVITGGSISVVVPGAASYTLTCSNVYNDTDAATLNFTLNPAPTVPGIVSQQYDEANGTFTLAWAPSSDDDGVAEYRVFLNGQLVESLPNTATSYTFYNILAGSTYVAEVRAVDVLGAISSAATASFGNSIEEEVGVPNTGVLDLSSSEGRGVLVLALGIVAVITIGVLVKKRSTR